MKDKDGHVVWFQYGCKTLSSLVSSVEYEWYQPSQHIYNLGHSPPWAQYKTTAKRDV